MQIAIDRIHPASEPIRKSWDEDKLNELAQSIAEQGLIVPIKVRPNGDGYEVVYGHRRLEAVRRNGAATIECIVAGIDDTDALIQALIENVQREDMSALDKAAALKSLMDRTGWTFGELQRRGISAISHAERLVSLLQEPAEITSRIPGVSAETPSSLVLIRETKRHGFDTPTRVEILDKVEREGLNERQGVKMSQAIAAAPSEQAKKKLLEWEYSPSIHDPELIKSRAAIHGAHDPLYQNNSDRTVQKTWDSTPEVKMAIDGVVEAAKMWTALIAEIRKMVQVGKLAPEGKSFTASKLRSLANTLNRFADELEQED